MATRQLSPQQVRTPQVGNRKAVGALHSLAGWRPGIVAYKVKYVSSSARHATFAPGVLPFNLAHAHTRDHTVLRPLQLMALQVQLAKKVTEVAAAATTLCKPRLVLQVTAVQAQLAWEDAGLAAAAASRDLKPRSLLQVMALQAQLALKDAEVAAAAAQLDASGAGPAFTPIPVGLTRLSALPSGSGDTGSQRGGSLFFLFFACSSFCCSGMGVSRGVLVHAAGGLPQGV